MKAADGQTGKVTDLATPRSLVSVLGAQVIQDVIGSYIDYVESAVAAYEADGQLVDRAQVGNQYCRLLLEAVERQHNQGPETFFSKTRRTVTATIGRMHSEEFTVGGMTVSINPVIVNGIVVGAVAGIVSGIPTDEELVARVASESGADFTELLAAARGADRKPDYLYSAARRHLVRLADTIGRLYQDAIEKEQAIASINECDLEIAAMRELDERILGSMTSGVAVFDLDLRVRVWNSAAESIAGITADAALGSHFLELMPKGKGMGYEQELRKVIESGEQNNLSGLPFERPGVEPTVLDVTATPLRDKSDAISGVVVIFNDMTEELRVRHELEKRLRELEALNRVVEATSGSLNTSELLSKAANELKETTGADLIAIYTLEDDLLTLGGSTREADEKARAIIGSYDVGVGVIGRAAQTGEVEVVFDLAGDDRVPASSKELSVAQGVNSLIAIPIKASGDILGVLTIMSHRADICSEERIRFSKMLAAQLGISMQNSHFIGEIERSGQFLHNLLDSMTESAYTCDLERRFTYVNASTERISGYAPEELIGKSIAFLIPEDQLPKLQEMMVRRNAGHTDSYDIDIIRKDGARVTINQTVSPMYQDGAIVGIVGVAADVTQRRELNRRLENQNQRLKLLQSIMSESVSGLDRGTALKILVHEVAETFGFEFCNIFMPSADGSRLRLVASHGYTDEFIRQLNESDTLTFENATQVKMPVMAAYQEGRQAVVHNITEEIREHTLLEAARSYGFHSMVATPLEYHGERLGALVVYTPETREFDEEELGLLSSIAAQAATIAGSERIFNQLALSEERYRELYDSAADWLYTLDKRWRHHRMQ